MSKQSPAHTDRGRAESFGVAADEYDRHRPRYPWPLIAGLVARQGIRALDVGAGTGIAAAQLTRAGADVLAVEPDSRMARVAESKGIRVERATFEQWRPSGRTFDLVIFAQSFHWVDPRPALEKVATILSPGGRLALLVNRIAPIAPTQQELDEINADYLDVTGRSIVNAEDEVCALVHQFGFSVERRSVVEHLHYTAEDYLNLVFTYSNHLALDPTARAQLRTRLAQRIGPAGVDAKNSALALVCTQHRDTNEGSRD